MRRVALDTSVIVAALLAAHERHAEAIAALRQALSERPVLPVPSLVEAYAVLTRLPAPLRIKTTAARDMLVHTFRRQSVVAPLDVESPWSLLADAADRQVAGGSTYDLQIAHCARGAGATHLMTLNARHFARVAPDLTLVVPG